MIPTVGSFIVLLGKVSVFGVTTVGMLYGLNWFNSAGKPFPKKERMERPEIVELREKARQLNR